MLGAGAALAIRDPRQIIIGLALTTVYALYLSSQHITLPNVSHYAGSPDNTLIYRPPISLDGYGNLLSAPPLPSYPLDPAQPPAPGWTWRGRPGSVPGSKQGAWYNPNTDESLRSDLDHGEPVGPHWDYKDSNGEWYRWYPDGRVEPKK